MNDNFNDQKEKLVSLSHEINLLRQQVSFLLRNEKALGLLDLDVLMNRTHTIYDMLCAINLGDNADDEDVDFDAEAFTNMLGAMMTEEETATPVEEKMPQPEPEEETPAEPVVEPEPIVEPEPVAEPDPVAEPEPIYEPEPEPIPMPMMEEPVEDNQPVANEPEIAASNPVETSLDDGFGSFFRFEEVPPVAESAPAEPDFELSSPETLADKMIGEDHSLAAKFQQNPVRDLKSVIGINDKFLFVNELFGGSMEKYNKSIDNLNDLKTLNGAMIYLNELKIELQWNNSNEAYQKLSELVRRKFE